MAESSGFFRAKLVDGVYDRTYLAEEFAKYFSMFIGNGIFSDSGMLAVTSSLNGMKVKVSLGRAWINGYWYCNDEELEFSLSNADGILNRIDLVVLRWSSVDRAIGLAVKEGVLASSPAAPEITRTSDTYELCLASIYVAKGSTSVTASSITDKRLDSSVCGTVGALVTQWDMSKYGAQLNGFIDDYITKADGSYTSFTTLLEDWLETYKETSQEEFTTWFEHMKGQLSEDAAGNLQLQIETLGNTVSNTKLDIFNHTNPTNKDHLSPESNYAYLKVSYDDSGDPVATSPSSDGFNTSLYAAAVASSLEALVAPINRLNTISKAVRDIGLAMHPIGSIYMSTNNINPGQLFGGTWVSWGSGRVPVGVNTGDANFNVVEKTGGESTHLLTVAEMPAHAHSTGLGVYGDMVNEAAPRVTGIRITESVSVTSERTGTTGGTSPLNSTQAHNNLQPYITCYMWKRTA